jgi:hypothetical protein
MAAKFRATSEIASLSGSAMQRTAALCFFVACFSMGCGAAGPPTYRIEGKVSLDKTPVANAQLLFDPEDRSQGAIAAHSDEDGAYDVDLRAGNYTVRILAHKTVPANAKIAGPSGGALTTMTVDIIPPKYNVNSTLRKTVEGPGEMNFELSSR